MIFPLLFQSSYNISSVVETQLEKRNLTIHLLQTAIANLPTEVTAILVTHITLIKYSIARVAYVGK